MSTAISSTVAPVDFVVPTKLMTAEEFLAIPEDDIERSLIRGIVREQPMTRRNRFHASAEAALAKLIGLWRDQLPEPRGQVFSGELGCILARHPDSTVGIDVAYVSAAVLAQQTTTSTMLDGPPTLAAEILSPSDVIEVVYEKIELYLHAGVEIVWILDPYFKTVTVHRAGHEPELFNRDMILAAEPQLPGLLIPVRSIFE